MDFVLTDGDLTINNGDFVLDETQNQDAWLIMAHHKGSFKQFPLIGIGESRLINGVLDGELRREIQLQLEADGKRLNNLNFNLNSTIDLDFL
jgi:hypothetical protein